MIRLFFLFATGYCGDTPGWTRIVHLDMTNTSQLCPSGWFEETTNGLRLCGRNTTLACSSAIFSTDGLEYSQVCGQARGYQYGDVIGFSDSYRLQDDSIDLPYADGLTLTHRENGSRIHIWTFANGMLEDHGGSDICPCAPNFSGATIPAFVGSNYFCESGAYNPVELFILHDYDPLWDGSGCNLEGNTCCEFNSPPYFSTQLPSNTTDDIEGRICNGLPFQSGYTYITFLEIFIK